MNNRLLVDSHCHLDLIEPQGHTAAVVARATAAGVGRMITIGIDLASSRWAVECARKHPEVFATIGVHPHDAKGIEAGTYAGLEKLARADKVLAYGEIGLDFFRMHSPREVQLKRFYEQIEVARGLGLPLIIHSRQALAETVLALDRTGAHDRAGIIHCYSGDAATARQLAERGWLISIPGTVTYPKANKLAQVVREVDLRSLVVETDAPFLAPVPHKGTPNEPAFVVHTARKVAELKGVGLGELVAVSSANLARVLGLPALAAAEVTA